MSIIFMDSFDHYTTSAQMQTKGWFTVAGGTGVPSTAQKRTGGYSMCGNGNLGAALLMTAVPNGTAFYVQVAVYLSGAQAITIIGPSGNPIDSNSYQCLVKVDATGVLSVATWPGPANIGATPAGTFRFNQWNHLQMKFVISNTVGEVEIYLNGALVLDLANQDTLSQSGSPATVTSLFFGSSYTQYYDDLVVNYNDADGINDGYLGDVRVVCLLPQTDAVAAGSNADFTPSTGTDHGALVDEATPNDDTDYVSSSTLNHVDSWEFPALGYTGDIKGVQMSLRAKKSDSGTRAIAAVTKPAATNRVHATNHYLGMTDYVYWKAIWDENPEDTEAWEVADVDGAEFGVKVTV